GAGCTPSSPGPFIGKGKTSWVGDASQVWFGPGHARLSSLGAHFVRPLRPDAAPSRTHAGCGPHAASEPLSLTRLCVGSTAPPPPSAAAP
uniref:Uncharacterized protein n=1 Tax=Aegilops tauschii subsp. strangulata TaxID=200361 RepID=A0A452ZAX0_AEGTS